MRPTFLCGAIVAAGVSAVLAQAAAPDPVPQDPVEAIVRAFDRKPLVALAEAHALQEEHDLIVRLVRDPRFADAVSTIVVEWANALYQDSIDRYVGGEDEPRTVSPAHGGIPGSRRSRPGTHRSTSGSLTWLER